jgi:hypothetical protein
MKLTQSTIEYRFALINHARDILRDAGAIDGYRFHPEQYEAHVLALAEKIHAWVEKDLSA